MAAISNGEDCTEQRIKSCNRSIAIKSSISETVPLDDNDICRTTEMQFACLEEMGRVCAGNMDPGTLGIFNTHIFNAVNAMRLSSCNKESDKNGLGASDKQMCIVKESFACTHTMHDAAERVSQLPPSLERKNETCRVMREGYACLLAIFRKCVQDQLVVDLALEVADMGRIDEQIKLWCANENYTGFGNFSSNLYNLPITVNGEDCSMYSIIASFEDLRGLLDVKPEINTLKEWDSICRKLRKGISGFKRLITSCYKDPYTQTYLLTKMDLDKVIDICPDETINALTQEITLDQWTAPAVGNEVCPENPFLVCMASVYDYRNIDTTTVSLKYAYDVCRVLKEGMSCLKRKLRFCVNNPEIERKILELSGMVDYAKNIADFCTLEDDQPDGKKCAFYMRITMEKKCLTDIKTESDNFKICCSKYEILECVNKTTADTCGAEGAQLAIDMTTRIYWPPERQAICDKVDKMSCSSDTTRIQDPFILALVMLTTSFTLNN